MKIPNDNIPQLPGWIVDHMRRYVETNGSEGHIWNGVPTLLLTTIGRRSHRPQMLPLIYGKDGEVLLIVASKGGAPAHPSWYLNLCEEPRVKVQVGAEAFDAIARTASDEERRRWWPLMVKIWPAYNEYQSKTERQIPIVALERA